MTSESNPSGTSPSGAGTHPARLTVLSGPSGVGKGTVFGVVRERYPQVWLSVSVTTRKPRPYEVEGREYHFVDEPEFERLVRAGELLEWAHYAGYSYGTPRRPVEEKLAAGVPALLEIDVQGARQVRAAMPEAQLVFLAPPSWEELVRRLVGRGTEDDETVKRRLALVESELASEPEFDATIVNHAVDEAAAELVELLTRPHSNSRT